MARNGHKWVVNFNFFFLQNWKSGHKTKIVIYVIAFDPINIFIDWLHQNDLQFLSFVEVINVVGEKMAMKYLIHNFVIFIFNHSLYRHVFTDCIYPGKSSRSLSFIIVNASYQFKCCEICNLGRRSLFT